MPPAATSAMNGRYLARDPLLRAALIAADTGLHVILGRPGPAAPLAAAPERVLLAFGGHLGDAVIASAVLPLIRRVWPTTEIGVVTGSWSRGVLEGHPAVRRLHTVDHWKLDRSSLGPAGKLRRYRTTRASALREIAAARYDAAVDLYPYFPNAVGLLYAAGIPVRAGFDSAGLGRLLTHAQPWRDAPRHVAESHLELLARLDPRFRDLRAERYSLPEVPAPTAADLPAGEYLLIHMGAGLTLKEWPAERWATLVDALAERGMPLVFTGAGAGQREAAARIIRGRAGLHNLCDRLDWAGFAGSVARAEAVVSIDSVAAHLAAAAGVPVVVLTSGMNRVEQWRPLGAAVEVVTRPVPCAPCFQSEGCAAMTCIREVEVAEVLLALERLTGSRGGAEAGEVPAGVDTRGQSE